VENLQNDIAGYRIEILKCFESIVKVNDTDSKRATASLLNAAIFEIDRLVMARDDLDYLCLHTRNLYEIYLILLHISSDKNHVKEWYGQLHRDVTDITEGFTALLVKYGIDASQLAVSQELADTGLNLSDYESKRPFNIRSLAKKYGELEEYLALYKFCSKFAHPSSAKTNTYGVFAESSDYKGIVLFLGAMYAGRLEDLSRTLSRDLA
jgi:hypothetical protein